MLAGSAAHGQSLTEAEVIRRARKATPSATVAMAAAAVAEAHESGRGLTPDPTLAYGREHLPGGSAPESEDAIAISLPIDLSGRRATQRALARSATQSAHAAAVRARSRGVMRALGLFYAAIGEQRRTEIARQTAQRFGEAARVIKARRHEGTASGYEGSRVEIEAALARSALRRAEAKARLARQEIALLLGMSSAPAKLEGDLQPAKTTKASTRPSLLRTRAAAEAAANASDEAGSAWVPTITLSGGLRIVAAGETRIGYVAGLSLPLPLFDRGQGVAAEAAARETLARAKLAAAQQQVRIDVARAKAQLFHATAQLAQLNKATTGPLTRLTRATASGYREGRRTLVELIDAERTRALVAHRRLSLAVAAKRAEIALRAAQGEFER